MPEKAKKKSDEEDVEEHGQLAAKTVYEIVRQEGQEQLERPPASLWWSGVAAGLSMSFSLLSQALLRHMLPDAAWTPLVADFGYCVGFLTAVLGRQQLFTETTITVILPIFAEFTRRNVFLGMRMWAIVLTANITGTFLAAAFFSFAPVVSADVRSVMIDISQHAMMPDGSELLFRAIVSGFLIALMVWMLPSAEGTEFHLIVMVTYLISIASFAHIVAGSMEGFMLVISGEQSLLHMLVHFTLPVLTGNVIGGTALFAVLSYAQVMHEI